MSSSSSTLAVDVDVDVDDDVVVVVDVDVVVDVYKDVGILTDPCAADAAPHTHSALSLSAKRSGNQAAAFCAVSAR